MQESGGCVRAPTTNYGVRNLGLMQDHDGGGTCNSDVTGQVQNPCPSSEIQQMISDGTGGTDMVMHLLSALMRADGPMMRTFIGLREFTIVALLRAVAIFEDGIATHCYASDIANRLTGWVWAPHGCTLDE